MRAGTLWKYAKLFSLSVVEGETRRSIMNYTCVRAKIDTVFRELDRDRFKSYFIIV